MPNSVTSCLAWGELAAASDGHAHCNAAPVVGWRAVEIRVGHFEVSGDERLEHDLCRWNACDGQCALGGAVVRHRSADHLVTRGLAGKLEVLLDQLDGALHRLAATRGEEHVIQVTGRQRRLQFNVKTAFRFEEESGTPGAQPARWRGGAHRTIWGSSRGSWLGDHTHQRAPGDRARAGM
jgi:hypothetical protein